MSNASVFFIDVGKYTSNLNVAAMGDIGWDQILLTQWNIIARHWRLTFSIPTLMLIQIIMLIQLFQERDWFMNKLSLLILFPDGVIGETSWDGIGICYWKLFMLL